MIINSDSLVLPRMGWEMWHVPHAWQHFQWPRVPSLFPDMLWFFLAERVGLDWRTRWTVFLLSLCLMTVCMASVIWRMGNLFWLQSLFLSSVTLTTYVACVSAGVYVKGFRDMSGLLELFLPAYHGSSFMLSLLAATMANMEYDRGSRIANFYPAACLCLVATFSDPLFVTTFAVPFALSTRVFALVHRKGTTPVWNALKEGIAGPVFLLAACTVGFMGQELLYKQNLGECSSTSRWLPCRKLYIPHASACGPSAVWSCSRFPSSRSAGYARKYQNMKSSRIKNCYFTRVIWHR